MFRRVFSRLLRSASSGDAAPRVSRPWVEPLEGRHLLATLTASPPYQNPGKHLDVDHNHVIEATDAAHVRDFLQRAGAGMPAPAHRPRR